MLPGVPTACDLGGKRGNNGHVKWWRGYKLHLDVADGQIPISALLTAASVHDSQVAIPLMEMSSNRVTSLYDIMDSAYDATTIRQASTDRQHQPIIHPHTRPHTRQNVQNTVTDPGQTTATTEPGADRAIPQRRPRDTKARLWWSESLED